MEEIVLMESRYVYFYPNETSIEMQKKIDEVPRVIPDSVFVIFKFTGGVYKNITQTLIFQGFTGGGTLRIFGELYSDDAVAAEAAKTAYFTQDSVIDTTVDVSVVFQFTKNTVVNTIIEHIRFNFDSGNSINTAIQSHNTQYSIIRYCSFVTPGQDPVTSRSRAIVAKYNSWLYPHYNHFDQVWQAIVAVDTSTILSDKNVKTNNVTNGFALYYMAHIRDTSSGWADAAMIGQDSGAYLL
jgi:hypothetical protein